MRYPPRGEGEATNSMAHPDTRAEGKRVQLLAALFPLPPAPNPVERGGLLGSRDQPGGKDRRGLGPRGQALERQMPLGKGEELWGCARVALMRDELGLSFKRKIVIKDQKLNPISFINSYIHVNNDQSHNIR